ncbi:MAG: glycine cleavage system protein GcvH [Thermaerobacterales bacterium]
MAEQRYPDQLKYTKEHEWIKVEGGQGVIGITWFAQDQLGDVVFVELPQPGASLKQDEPFGVVESVKTVSDLYAPISGEVVEINDALIDAPEKVNDDPYGDGWMIVLKVADADQVDALLSAEAYRELVEE